MECHSCTNTTNHSIIWNMSQEVRKIFATNLKKIRESSGVRREKLALILGFDNSYISKLEKGKVNITIDKMAKIADFFNMELSEFLK